MASLPSAKEKIEVLINLFGGFVQKQLVGRQQLLRDLNYRAVLESIAHIGPISRVEVAHQLKLSQPSVSRVAEALIQADLLVEGERIASKAGRKQVLLDINPETAVVAGLSIRSKFVRILLTDLKGDTLAQKQIPRQLEGPTSLVQQVKNLISEVCETFNAPLAAVCVGISGAWDNALKQVHSAPNLAYLENVDLHTLLKTALDDEFLKDSIAIENDVNYAALGEYTYGAAEGFESFFYLNLGSGIGGGIVVHGKLHTGFQGFAGEIGFLPVYHDGEYQSLESLVSRIAIDKYVQDKKLADDTHQLFEFARAGHKESIEFVRSVGHYIALALCSVTTVLNPELIVIGGSIGRYSDLLIPFVEEQLAEFLPKMPNLIGTALGGDASLKGAVARSLELARTGLVTRRLL